MPKPPIVALAVLFAGAVLISCASQPATTTPSPPAPAAAASQTSGRAGAVPVMPDSINEKNEAYVARVTAAIAGRENLPAEQVFKDIQLLKGTPASRVLAIMNAGYSRALGVSCEHCHDPEAFESNAKEEKARARGMIRMVNMINEGNRSIPEFANDPVVVNCTVCHRGARRPVRNIPAPGGR